MVMSCSKPGASNGIAGRSDDFYPQPSTSSVTCFLCSFKHIDAEIVQQHMNQVHFDLVVPSEERRTTPVRSVAGRSDDPYRELEDYESSTACFMCSFSHEDPYVVEDHMNEVHFGRAQVTLASNSHQASDFICPMCPETFSGAKDLQTHVNRKHKDILSPMKTPPASDKCGILSPLKTPPVPDECKAVNTCPVCNDFSSESTDVLQRHIDDHFSNRNQPDIPANNSNAELSPKRRRQSEDRELELLKIQYGMDDKGDFKKQSTSQMQKAVCSGKLSLPDYYERQSRLKSAEYCGVDDGSSCVKGVIPRIRDKSRLSSHVIETYLCFNTDFYSAACGDQGWGCGYRNLQMLLSALSRNKTYSELLAEHFSSLNQTKSKTMNFMPSITQIQQMIEWAWEQGFDVKGCEQLGGKVCGTRKWIGATEVVSLLSAMKIKCELVDTLKPSVTKLHYRMFDWILSYFKRKATFKPPLYLQHKGHSRTIVGVETAKGGDVTLLILDPGIPHHKIGNMLASSNPFSTLKLLRRSLTSETHEQYQIVSVCGVIESEEEYQDLSGKAFEKFTKPDDLARSE